MKHHLILIGYISIKKAYLDISRDEAVRRFIASEDEEPEESNIKEFDFEDEFNVYDAWPESVYYRSYYRHCGQEWNSVWPSACDDECPECGHAISPYKYEQI